MSPQLRRVWRSRGSITDPEFYLDVPLNCEPAIVAPPTRLELLGGTVVLVFRGAAYTPHTVPGSLEEFPHYPLRYFITYCTRIDYNIVYPDWQQDAEPLPPETDDVRFHLSRSVTPCDLASKKSEAGERTYRIVK